VVIVYCLDCLIGVERWRQPTHSSGSETIVIEPDHIVCAKGGYVDCFAPSGAPLWSQPLSGYGLGRSALGYPGNVAQADDRGEQPALASGRRPASAAARAEPAPALPVVERAHLLRRATVRDPPVDQVAHDRVGAVAAPHAVDRIEHGLEL
jgi:hypothetical protein